MTKETTQNKGPPVPHVYQAIAAITAAMAKDGISKDRKNQQQNYSFRGIDDVYNALAPMLAENNLCILPRVLERVVTERERTDRDGKVVGALFNVTVKVEFDFISAIDGSKHVVTTYGEAMDTADKATNKAMSAAYKYSAIQTFCIPTEGDNDADAQTLDTKPRGTTHPARNSAPATASAFKTTQERVDWLKEAGETVDRLVDPEAVERFKRGHKDKIESLGAKQREWLDSKMTARLAAVSQAPIRTNGVAHA